MPSRSSWTRLPWKKGSPATGQVASLAKKRQNSRVPTPPCSSTASAPPTSEYSPCPRPRNGPVGVNGQEAARGLSRAQRTEDDRISGTPSPRPSAPHSNLGQEAATELCSPGRGALTGTPWAEQGPPNPVLGRPAYLHGPASAQPLVAAAGSRGLSGCGAVGRGWGCGEPGAQDAAAATAAQRVRVRVELSVSREQGGRLCV